MYDNRRTRKALARMVRDETRAVAAGIAAEAATELTRYRNTGDARIRLERAGATDWLVSLADPDGGAMAIEYGRSGGVDRRGRRKGATQGKNILGRHL